MLNESYIGRSHTHTQTQTHCDVIPTWGRAAVVALLLGILPGLLHPGEDLLGQGRRAAVGSPAGWRLFLLGARAVGTGGGCRQRGRLLLGCDARGLAVAVPSALIAALTHAVSIQVGLLEGWWPDGRRLDRAHRALIVALQAGRRVGLVSGAIGVRVWFGVAVASKESRVVVVGRFLHFVGLGSKPINQCDLIQWHGWCLIK